MVWPADRTQTLTDVSNTVHEEVARMVTDLVTAADGTPLKILADAGCINPYAGGDRYTVETAISTGETEVEFDPAAHNPTETLGTTGYRYMAPCTYFYGARTKNLTINQAQGSLNSDAGMRRVFDLLSRQQRQNATSFFENLQGEGTLGMFSTTGKLPTAGNVANFKALFADNTSDLGGVDVSTYTKFQPTIGNSTADGSKLIESDIQDMVYDCDFGVEGGVTDFLTSLTVLKKISALLRASNSILAIPSDKADLGHGMSIPWHGGINIHGTKRITAKHAAWDVSGGATAEWPFIAIDTTNFEMRYSVGEPVAGSEVKSELFSDSLPPLIHLVTDFFPHATNPKLIQRQQFVLQMGFSKDGGYGSRRTSGQMEGLNF